LRKAGIAEREIDLYQKEALSGDFDNCLAVTLAWVGLLLMRLTLVDTQSPGRPLSLGIRPGGATTAPLRARVVGRPPGNYNGWRKNGALAAKRKQLANLSKKIHFNLEYFSTAVITRMD
jgi:hypothetical protein